MADEIKLKAPTVEQQVVVNINGEEKLKSFADTLDKISNNKNLQKYWKTQQDLINATADAYSNFQKKASKDNASELIKVTNALKAMSGTDLSHIIPDFDKISKSMAEAQKVAGNIDSAFSVKGFKEAFDSFETLKAYGTDVQKLFSHFGVSFDIGELQQNVRLLEGEVEKLTRRLSNAKNANEELRNEFENFKVGSGFADKLDELDRLKAEMQNIRDEATQTFNQFLDANKIDRYDWFSDDRFAEYFEKLENGTLTATDAIRRFKSEYSYLLEDSYKSSGDSFGLDQLQAFSTKLDSIFHQVEETSNKINDILSNGVIAKSVQNLSEDITLSDSQRSIFGNILQDEESLKSITALFQKLIDETNQTKNTEVFNTEQFTKIESLFTSIESSLSSIKGVLVDVGDGEELSPLLKQLDNIREATSNIKLSLNLDLGNEVSERLNQKVSQSTQRQLEAYRKLFSAMKGTGKTNKEMLKFFEPDEASATELIGAYQGIIKRAEEKFKVGNSNIYKKLLGSTYDDLKKEIKNANAQLGRAENKRSENGILGDLFGSSKDLSGVIEQLNIIVSKLDEISVSAKGFTETFKNGLNINASVEEIEKLTNRVKELESELAKIKTPTVATLQESNISSGSNPAIEQQNKLQEELKETQQQAEKAHQSISKLVESRDIVSQNWYREKGTVVGKDSKGNDITRDADEFSFVERLKNGQLQTVLATYDEKTEKWAEQIINVRTAFEQVEKAIISADNKIASLEMTRDKTLAAHPGYDATADNNQITIERKKRDELQNTLNLYGSEKEYIFEIEAATKRIADNQERLNNKKQSQTNLRQVVSDEQFLKDWDAAIAENNKRDTKSAKQAKKELNDAWNEAVKVNTALDETKATLSSLSKMPELTSNFSDMESKVSSLNSDLTSGKITLSEYKNEVKSVTSEYSKMVSIQQKRDVEDALRNANNSQIDYMNSVVQRFQNNLGKYSADVKREGYKPSTDFVNAVSQYESEVNDLQSFVENLSKTKVVDQKQINSFKQLTQSAEEAKKALQNMSASEKGMKFVSIQKEIDKINQILRENPKFCKEAKNELKSLMNQLMSGDPTANLEKIHTRVLEIKNAEELAGRAGKNFLDILASKSYYGFIGQLQSYMSMYVGFYGIMNSIKSGLSTIRELDTALTEMRKVSDETVQTLKDYQKESFNTADAIATSGLQMQNSIADWQRLGYSIKEANELAKNSNIYKNVGDMDISTATEHMVSSVQAWKSEFNDDAVKTSEEVMNRYNKIGNEFAISSADIGEAMETSAAALKAGGNDLNEALGIITAGNIIQQDASTTSSAMKILSLRIRGAKADLESMGESTDDLADSTSKLRDEIKSLTGVDIMVDEDTFKSTTEIIKELGAVWNQLSDVSQAATLEKIAGKNRASTVAGLIENYETIDKVIEAASNADNSALDENQKVIESIDGRIQQLSNRVQEFWQTVINGDSIKWIIDSTTTVLEVLTNIISKLHLIPTLIGGIGAGIAIKNVGEHYIVPVSI